MQDFCKRRMEIQKERQRLLEEEEKLDWDFVQSNKMESMESVDDEEYGPLACFVPLLMLLLFTLSYLFS